MRKHYFIMTVTLMMLSILVAKADDSIPAIDLQELVVKSERSWIENGVFNFVPTKKEKKLSNSPGTLIDVMNIPVLKSEGDIITTISNESVVIFINGEPANDIDIATFWPSEVKKVEYMQNPSDPTFRGARNVVNFIVAKYEAGGVTRINARQEVPMTLGNYGVASKLNYKRMSYGVNINSFCIRNKDTKSESITTYRDIFYDGIKREEIVNQSYGSSDDESWNTTVSTNAKYTSERFVATHTVGLGWKHIPGNSSSSNNRWSDNLFGSDFSQAFYKSRSLSPTLEGEYYWAISNLFSISGFWVYAYNHNNNSSWNQWGDTPRIANDIDEQIHSLPVSVSFSYRPNAKWTFFLSLNPKTKWYETSYSGSTYTDSKQFREDFQTRLTAYWRPLPQLLLTLQPILYYYYYKIDDTVNKNVDAACQFAAQWYPHRKFNLTATVHFFNNPISASASNPVIYKQNELTWVRGDARLKPGTEWLYNLTATYLAADWLSFSPVVYYISRNNSVCSFAEVAPVDMGGVIYTQLNTGRFHEFNGSLDARLSLLNNKLSISLSGAYKYQKAEKGYFRSLHYWQPGGNVSYIVGNFRLQARYRARRKVFSDDSGDRIRRQPDNFSFGVSYGWKNLYAYCGVDNLFHSKNKSSTIWYSD
ncbi:MAG: outer membrane beta-barrel family protein [Muribaculaceae bacterium]|nr:outer membrane beta-barrel family protein [Muribaculaceae bacterium]